MGILWFPLKTVAWQDSSAKETPGNIWPVGRARVETPKDPLSEVDSPAIGSGSM